MMLRQIAEAAGAYNATRAYKKLRTPHAIVLGALIVGLSVLIGSLFNGGIYQVAATSHYESNQVLPDGSLSRGPASYPVAMIVNKITGHLTWCYEPGYCAAH